MKKSIESLTILVVDDQISLQNLIATILRTVGVGTVLDASNAKEAKQIISLRNQDSSVGSRIDVVMVDIMLSADENEGFDLVDWIRTDKESPNRFLSVMMFSAMASYSMVRRARDLGTNGFLRKPFAVNDLANLLIGVVKDRRDFIETDGYFGPDRRRRQVENLIPAVDRRSEDSKAKIFEFQSDRNISYVLSKSNIERAKKRFKQKTEAALSDLDKQMNQLVIISQRLRDTYDDESFSSQASEKQEKSVQKLADIILDRVMLVRMNLGVFRVPTLSELAKDLSEFFCQMMRSPREYVNDDSIKITERFISFMKVSIQHFDQIDSSSSKTVIDELSRVRLRFQGKYIKNPLSVDEVDKLLHLSMQRIRSDKELNKLLC